MSARRRVFVVDDDAAVRTTIGELLEVCGFEVRTFPSGRALLDVAGALEPGCILLDLRMPELSGLEVRAELDRRGVHLPVIFLTAHGDVSTGVAAMKGGAVDFLTKPVRDTVLLEALEHGFARLVAEQGRREARARARGLVARLTAREREVAALVVSGLRNRDIAERLDITLPTVKVHRGRAMAKLRVESVADLVRLWQDAHGEQ